MIRRRSVRGTRIVYVYHRRKLLSRVKQFASHRIFVASTALIVTGLVLIVYSLGQSNVIDSPFVQQGQLRVSSSTSDSFQFGQPADHGMYVNFTMPANASIHYTLYEMPSYQVAFYSNSTSNRYINFYLHDTQQHKLYSQPLSKLTLISTGNASSGSTIILNKIRGTLGEEYLLKVTSSGNASFAAQVSATTDFKLVEHSDKTTGISGGILSFAGLLLLAVGITRIYGNK